MYHIRCGMSPRTLSLGRRFFFVVGCAEFVCVWIAFGRAHCQLPATLRFECACVQANSLVDVPDRTMKYQLTTSGTRVHRHPPEPAVPKLLNKHADKYSERAQSYLSTKIAEVRARSRYATFGTSECVCVRAPASYLEDGGRGGGWTGDGRESPCMTTHQPPHHRITPSEQTGRPSESQRVAEENAEI